MDDITAAGDDQLDSFDPEPGSSFDELIEAGWDPGDMGDPASDPDDEEAWLAGLPEDVRADYLAGPYTGAGEVIPAGFTHREPGGPSGAGFAAGGALDGLPPGPWLAQALADATAASHDELNESELVGVLLGWQRLAAWSQAGLAGAAGALAARRRAQAAEPGWSRLGEHVADELAVALRLTGRSAGRLLDVASGLARLADVAAALATGAIDWPKACLFVDELTVLSDEQARTVAARLLERAGEQTTGQLRAALARAVLAADPGAAQRRQSQGRKDARVEVWHEPSGNATLAGRELASADAIAADAALSADAEWLRGHGVAGTLAELRAAAFIARLSAQDLASLLPRDDCTGDSHPDRGSSSSSSSSSSSPASGNSGHRAADNSAHDGADNSAGSGGGPGSPAPGPGGSPRTGGTIHLTMPLAALAGLTDAPGEVAGYGPADADTCRDLAARLGSNPTTRWCLTLTSASGAAVAHVCPRAGPRAGQPVRTWAAGLSERLQFLQSGTCQHPFESRGYSWPPALRHLIEVRQRTCAAPGCRRPARACDIDHTMPYEQGGPTCECNGSPLCRRHHRAKQVPGWQLTQHRPGVMTWRLPGGRKYITTGDPYLA